MSELRTVKIYLPHDSGDFATINESDFDEGVHVRYEDAVGSTQEGAPKKRSKKANAEGNSEPQA